MVLHKYLIFQATDAFKITIYSELFSKQERNTMFLTLILFFVTLFFDIYSGCTSTIPTPTWRGILPRSLLRPWCAQSHQLCLNTGCHCCFGEPPQSSEIFMLCHSHILTKEIRYVATETTCCSGTATRSCNESLYVFLQQVNIYSKGLEGKYILNVIYMYMGINQCILIWSKLAYLIFQEFYHAW